MGQRSWQPRPGNVYMIVPLWWPVHGWQPSSWPASATLHCIVPLQPLIAPASHLLGLHSEPKAARIYRAGCENLIADLLQSVRNYDVLVIETGY